MLTAFISWWYGEGWKRQLSRVDDRLVGLLDMFSFGLLLKTLFSPYRQISAGQVTGPLAVQLHAFVDRLVSRFIGALIRTAVLVAGVATMLVVMVASGLQLLVWPLLPLLPAGGLLATLIGWLPWR